MLLDALTNLWNGRRSPLPPGARWVEYLESTGTQYINTGVIRGQTSQLRLQSTMSFSGSASANAFGWGQSLNGPCVGIKSGTPYMYFNLTGSDEYSTLTYTANTVVTIDIDGGSGKVTINDGTTTYTATRTVSTWTGSGEMVLFGFTNSVGVQPRNQRINACKIYANGVLVRDFIPVRVGSVGYLYDRVSGKLFGNVGTGAFGYGQDVVPVEYIESHGTEWIDLGVDSTADGFADFDLTFQSTASGGSRLVPFGYQYGGTARYGAWAVSTNVWGVGINNSNYTTFDANNDKNVVSVRNGQYIDINGTKTTIGAGTVRSNIGVSLFLRNQSSSGMSSYALVSAKVFDFALYNSSAAIRKMKPVRVGSGSTWEGAMMDTLTRRIYRNAGTGAFAYGADLPLETLA